MSETNDPFAAFKEGQPPAEAKAEDKPAKKARKKKAAARPANGGVDAVPSASSKASAERSKKTRKPRQKRELKLPLSTLVALGNLSSEESAVVQSITIGLADFSKKARGRVVAALAKIFE